MSIEKDQKAGRLEYWKNGIMGFSKISLSSSQHSIVPSFRLIR
jgi:hypothetical protein